MINLIVNGNSYNYPQPGDKANTGWGSQATNWANAVTDALTALGLGGTLTPTPNAVVDISSTTKGILIPRLTTTQRNAITSPATSLLIFNTTLGVFQYYTGSAWVTVPSNGYLCRAWVNFNGLTNNNVSGTYSQSGTTVTVTATSHGYIVGNQISISITTGTAANGNYLVTEVIDSNSFRYTAGTSLATSGNCLLVRSTIRASGNVSSISYNGTGDYTVNFTTPMPDVNYAILSSSEQSAGNSPVNINRNNSRTDTEYRTNICTAQGSTLVNISWVSIGIFR